MVPRKIIVESVRRALQEDKAWNDITSSAISPQRQARARVIMEEAGVLCGISVAQEAFRQRNRSLSVRLLAKDGAQVPAGTCVLEAKGQARSLLAAERTAVNFLQHLSGIATQTRVFVNKVRGTRAQIYDSRKTIPGLRLLEKYAVFCGGGKNHRLDLQDAVLLKDNHWPFLEFPFSKPRSWRNKFVQCEAVDRQQIHKALAMGVDSILLDNMTVTAARQAIREIRKISKKWIPIEISGGVTLKNVKAYALTGPDRISVGSLTHSPRSLGFHMDIEPLS